MGNSFKGIAAGLLLKDVLHFFPRVSGIHSAGLHSLNL